VPSARTTVTELATGLGMLGYPDVDGALAARPAAMVSVSPETWTRLAGWRMAGGYDRDFEAAFANGAAFLAAREGLRDRRPLAVEWKGSQRAPGDEVAPIDLRVDHVFLVSCKYLSKILCNSSPAHLFDDLLAGRHGRRRDDWYASVAPAELAELYRAVRLLVGLGLPADAGDLAPAERRLLAEALAGGWPDAAGEAHAALCRAVATRSAERWRAALGRPGEREPMLWRLLRMGGAPYFVLGTTPRSLLRLRIATPWDWRQQYRLQSFEVAAQDGGQPRVSWQAAVRDVHGGGIRVVRGHVEVRWSHGRFSGPPEAKVYLDTPHEDVPGYVPLA
jgi:hypothetical protein